MALNDLQAIEVVLALVGAGQSLNSVINIVTQAGEIYTQEVLGTQLAAMATCVQNADGTLGTADTTPSSNSGHVIDTRVYPTLAPYQLTAYQIGVLLSVEQAVVTLLGGVTVPAVQNYAPNLLATIAGTPT